MGSNLEWIRIGTDGGESWVECIAAARINGDVGFSHDRGKYRVNAAMHYCVRWGRECFLSVIKLIDRASSKVVHELPQLFDTLDEARAAIESYDPCDGLPTENGDAANRDVRRKLSTHYQSQKVAWDQRIERVFARVF